MSGIAGLLAAAGGTADARTLRLMLAALAHRGPDGEGVWASGPVALGHRAFWTTPEGHTEGQPWRDASAELAVAMDGRGFADPGCRTLARPRAISTGDWWVITTAIGIVVITALVSLAAGSWHFFLAR